MDFDFTDDQEQLRDAVRKWVDKGYDFERRRGIANNGGFSREAYGELAELGLTGLYIPEADGGLGMGPVEGMVVLEELGRGIVIEPFAHALISGAVLAHYAGAELKAGLRRELSALRRQLGQAQRDAELPSKDRRPRPEAHRPHRPETDVKHLKDAGQDR